MITLEKIDEDTYQGLFGNFDFHLRKEDSEWYVDIFSGPKNDIQHECTKSFPSFLEALNFVLEY